MLNIRLACNTHIWGDAPLETIIQATGALDYQGIELPFERIIQNPESVRILLERYKVDLSSAVLPVTLIDPLTFTDELERIEQMAQLLVSFDCLQMTIVGKPLDSIEISQELYLRFAAGCNEAGRRVMNYGVQLMLRNRTGTLFGSRRQIESVIAATEPEYLALAFDTAELLRGKASPIWLCRDHRYRIAYITMSDSSAGAGVPLGLGDIDIPMIVRLLYRTDYTGWFVLDPGGIPPSTPGKTGKPANPASYTPEMLAQISRKYMRALWSI